jgi:hypothetical protein
MAKKKNASYRDHVNSDSLSFCQTMWKECWLDCYHSTAGLLMTQSLPAQLYMQDRYQKS